jgi:hypothetical protein
MRAGNLYYPSELFDSVRGRLGPESAADADWWKGNVRLVR